MEIWWVEEERERRALARSGIVGESSRSNGLFKSQQKLGQKRKQAEIYKVMLGGNHIWSEPHSLGVPTPGRGYGYT